MKNTIYDAVIIGAGPAGSTAAFILASAGLKVVLLDRREFPRPKLCAGLLTWKTVQLLEKVFQCSPQSLSASGIVHHVTREYTVAGLSGRSLTRVLDHPFHLVDRQAYDGFWVHRAVAAGAEFRPGSTAVAVDAERGEAVTRTGQKWAGHFVIGADGIGSCVRRALIQTAKLARPRRQGIAAALECFLPRPPDSVPGPPAIYYGFIRWGYAWSFPGPKDQTVGIAALKASSQGRIGQGFRKFVKSLGLGDMSRLHIHAHPLPFGCYLSTPGWAHVMLVGDAAGLADPFLGEGIYYAHRSAQLAANAIVECRAHRESAAHLYRETYRRLIYPELRYARAGRQLIFSLPLRFYFPVLAACLRLFPKTCEETIQGQRSFKWFRRRRPS